MENNFNKNGKLKIGIISINIHTLNFACPLHSFAFSKVLTDLGYENVVINYYPINLSQNSNWKYSLIELLKENDINDPKKQKKIKSLINLFYPRKERIEKFEAFINKYYNLTENVYTSALMDSSPNVENINCYIAVTDTIWKTFDKGFDKGFLLACRAMKNSYKIAYSASRGPRMEYTEDHEKDFLKYIKDIHDISVRERSLAEYITSISDINAEVVCDPVFLMNKNFYESILIRPKTRGYILLYLVEEAKDLVAFTAKFAQSMNLDLIELSSFYAHKNQSGYSRHLVFYNKGIEEWLGYMQDAEYIFTNSFHGSCLSIILEKQFFFIGKRGGDKVTNLIKTFGLGWREIEQAFDKNGNMTVGDIDYTSVNIIRENFVQKSFDFLKKSLKKAENFIKEKNHVNYDYITTGNKFDCCGCTACEKKCPVNTVKMVQDDEGFYFPKIDENLCSQCGLCKRVCQYNNKKSLYVKPLNVYLAYNKNDYDRINSSSGGIFAAMYEYILKCGGAVVGVRFNENFEALYDIAETTEDCFKFRYSKYVEAMDNDIYFKTKAALDSGRKVLFTGTPCKNAGLLNYLDKDSENLYCADIICKGTNSPVMLLKYLEEKEKLKNSKLTHFQFRSPRAPQGPGSIEYIYENGETELLNKHKDLFMNSFSKNIMLKRSCYKCEYCGNNGISDITFGDFWGGEKYYFGEDKQKGISCVKINTLKGEELFRNLNVFAQDQTLEEMYMKNHKKPSPFPPQRDKIFDWINKDGLSATEAFKKALMEMERKE